MNDIFAPPRPLCADAAVVFERHAERIHKEGRERVAVLWAGADRVVLSCAVTLCACVGCTPNCVL
jgi:hypothetical protein